MSSFRGVGNTREQDKFMKTPRQHQDHKATYFEMLLRVFQRCGVLNRHTTSILKRRQSEFTVCRDDEKKIDVMRRLIQERSTDKVTQKDIEDLMKRI